MTDARVPVVAILENDLFFSVRMSDVVRALGARPEVVEDAETLWEAIDHWPAMVLLDLAVDPRWEATVRRAKNLPHTRKIPIVAFGSHVDVESLKAARAAGCDHAWARSRFMSELPSLLQGVLSPAPLDVPACAGPAPALLRQAVEEFNHGAYWECHETLEQLWMATPGRERDMYQGILQIGVAFHHLRERNYAGTLKMLRRALPRLRGFPELCQGVAVQELAAAALRIHDAVVAAGPAGIGDFDVAALPRIRLTEI